MATPNTTPRPRKSDAVVSIAVAILAALILLFGLYLIGWGFVLTPVFVIAVFFAAGLLHYLFWGRRWLKEGRSMPHEK